jgi:amino acid transporter
MTTQHPAPAPADDDRVTMTLGERSTWSFLALTTITSIVYYVIVVPRLFDQPVADIGWQVPMLWAIGATIVGSIVVAIIVAIVSAIITRRQPEDSDIREKQIERHGNRIAQAITAFGSVIVLALAMLELDWFWIGNALYLIGFTGGIVGAIVQLRAYHGVFRG